MKSKSQLRLSTNNRHSITFRRKYEEKRNINAGETQPGSMLHSVLPKMEFKRTKRNHLAQSVLGTQTRSPTRHSTDDASYAKWVPKTLGAGNSIVDPKSLLFIQRRHNAVLTNEDALKEMKDAVHSTLSTTSIRNRFGSGQIQSTNNLHLSVKPMTLQ